MASIKAAELRKRGNRRATAEEGDSAFSALIALTFWRHAGSGPLPGALRLAGRQRVARIATAIDSRLAGSHHRRVDCGMRTVFPVPGLMNCDMLPGEFTCLLAYRYVTAR